MLACQRHVSRAYRSASLPGVSNTGTLTLAATLRYAWAYEGMNGMAFGFHSIATV